MNAVKINERLTVAGQPMIADFQSLSAQGYKSIINARPDGEEPGQPGNVQEKSAASAAGMEYGFIPVSGPAITEADIRAFQQKLRKRTAPFSPIARAARAHSPFMFSAKRWMDASSGATSRLSARRTALTFPAPPAGWSDAKRRFHTSRRSSIRAHGACNMSFPILRPSAAPLSTRSMISMRSPVQPEP